MKCNRKGQSVSEYAIILGLVIAVAAGVTQILLKGALRDKQSKATAVLNSAGVGTPEWDNAVLTQANTKIYTQTARETTVNAADFKDATLLKRGGGEERVNTQSQDSVNIDIETVEANQ